VREHFHEGDQELPQVQHRRQSPRHWVPEADLIPIRGH
jgi:hypothetical protein